MRLSLFRGGYTTLESTEEIEDFDVFCDMVSDVKTGPKNGDYFVRGYCDGKRSDENIGCIDLLIIDGDQLIDNDFSCCNPDAVHNVISKRNITHVIYSSYSNDIINNRHKWRLCIPCDDICDQSTLKQGVQEILSILHSEGLMVKNVKENLVLSQPWFLPRCKQETCEDFHYSWHDGETYKISGKKPLQTTYTTYLAKNITTDSGSFSWDYVISQFSSGTVHNGLKSGIGWLIHTTDWVDSQIKKYFVSLVTALCPDSDKVKRVCETREIDSLIKFCREKHGVVEHSANWKDYLIDASMLKEKEFDDIKWAVNGVIPEGLTILAGDPKAGKSLMAVDICSAIASGKKAFGACECVAGDCVYISLEDPERRVKERIESQHNLWPESFKLLTGGVPQLGESIYRLFDEMVLLWPNLRCIIVDTMQFIIPPKKTGSSDYEHYYQYLDPLHKWSIDNHVSVVLITHTTKSKNADENPFSAIIGSVAIQGTADAMIMLNKNHAKTVQTDDLADGFLLINGREIGSEKFALDFDSELLKWTLRGEAQPRDIIKNANWIIISESIKSGNTEPKEIIEDTKLNGSTVRSCLKRMTEANLIKNLNGKYELVFI